MECRAVRTPPRGWGRCVEGQMEWFVSVAGDGVRRVRWSGLSPWLGTVYGGSDGVVCLRGWGRCVAGGVMEGQVYLKKSSRQTQAVFYRPYFFSWYSYDIERLERDR